MTDLKSESIEIKTAENIEVPARLLAPDAVVDDRYEVISHLGSGGMGEVYKVFDRATKGYYALKMIAPELARDKLVAKRLENEARAARTLVHGNIVSVYDVGELASGSPYLIMDFVDGESLEEVLKKEGMLAPGRALPIFIQIAEALVHARYKGVLHRDLKPSNILLTKTPGGADVVKIVDFGIAKISDQQSADKTRLTQTGELLGTPLYMSPEQCRGDELDGRSDIYSFGCIMYETLAGYPAFQAENQVLVILKHLNDEPPPLPVSVKISRDLRAIIFRCLEKDPRDRYDNAVELQIDLERVNDGRPIKRYKRRFRMTPQRKMKLVGSVLGICALLMMYYSLIPKATVTAPVPVKTHERIETYKGKTLAQWTTAIEQSPDDPSLYFARGELHSFRDERTNAIDDFSQAIALKPNYVSAYTARATEYVLIANYAKAAQDADTAIKLDPDSPSGYEARGWVEGAREQYAESMADWQHAISLSDNGYYHYQLSRELLRLARYDQAAFEIDKAINYQRNSNTPVYQGMAGIIATFRQDFNAAYRQLKQATDSPDARGVEWQELAYYYVCTGQIPAAEQAIQQAKAIETFPARAYRLAGELYRTAGLYEKAIQELSSSTSLEEYPPGYRERAVCYISLGQWRSAYDDLKKSLQLNPGAPTTMSFLAVTEGHLGMKQQASEHLAALFKSQALEPVVYANQAEVELILGNTKEALKAADTAVSLDPWLKEGYAARAQAYRKLNNNGAAQADEDKATKLISHLDL